MKEEESAAAAASVDVPLIAEEEEEVLGASAVTEELVDWVVGVGAGVLIELTVLDAEVLTGVALLEAAEAVGIGWDSFSMVLVASGP